MTRVSTPCRLHFGLKNAGDLPPDHWRFGGCGLMLADCRVTVAVEPAETWSGDGLAADRAVGFARAVLPNRPVRVRVDECPPEHVGLGVGTQLALATASATLLAHGLPLPSIRDLAVRTGRGKRSGVGLYGFAAGGFVSDYGHRTADSHPELDFREPVPAEWRVVLARPAVAARWHGESERGAFARLRAVGGAVSRHKELVRPVMAMQHDLRAADFHQFAALIHGYNRAAGEPFAADQGGVYAGPEVTALVEWVHRLGFAGVGQSSWGPTVFALTADAELADWLAGRLRRHDPTLAVDVSRPDNVGAVQDGLPVYQPTT